MKNSKIWSFILYFLIFSFVGALFSSFVVPENFVVPADIDYLSVWLQDNWAVIALVLSELAALLPGKPKGILHAIIKIGSKIFDRSIVKQKILKP